MMERKLERLKSMLKFTSQVVGKVRGNAEILWSCFQTQHRAHLHLSCVSSNHRLSFHWLEKCHLPKERECGLTCSPQNY